MNMYYDDLTEMWSSSSNLVDNAALLYEQEHSLADKGKSKRRTKKTVSREEEEDEERANNSFFHLFPRKSRSSMKKHVPRRDPQNPLQNPNGASTSSSLFDLNIIAADSETKDPQNPPSEPSSTPLLVDYNTAESEKTETKNPPNPKSQSPPSSCLTENTSRKRCAVEQNGAFKVMRSMNGGAYDPRLIFEKTLFMTDVNPGQSRLSIPFNNLIRNDFLTPLESRIIEEDINNNEKMGVGAILVDQRTVKWGVILKRWEMKKDSGNRSWNYALICGWNDIVKANGLKDGDNISLWSFRCRGILCFALVPTPVGRSSSYLKVFLSNNFSEL